MSEWTSRQVLVVLVCFLLNMADGADVLVLAFTSPAIIAEWNVSNAAFSLAFATSLAGMTIGSIVLGPLADIHGRRRIILASLAALTIATLLSAASRNIVDLALIRFFVGLGIGAMLASITALASESAPSRYKALAVTAATAGYPLGATLAGYLAGFVIPAFGWQAMFMTVSAFALFLMPLAFLLLREEEPAGDRSLSAPPRSRGFAGKRLLGSEFRSVTLLVWSAFFLTFFSLYFLVGWIPKIAIEVGSDLGAAVRTSATFNLGAFFGLIGLGYIASRTRILPTVAAFMAMSGLMMVSLEAATAATGSLLLSFFVLGLLLQGGFGGLYAIAADLYPREIRGTGIGWAVGTGRLGAIIGPVAGGMLFDRGFTVWAIVAWFGVVLFAVTIVLTALSLRGQPAL